MRQFDDLDINPSCTRSPGIGNNTIVRVGGPRVGGGRDTDGSDGEGAGKGVTGSVRIIVTGRDNSGDTEGDEAGYDGVGGSKILTTKCKAREGRPLHGQPDPTSG